MCLTEVMIDFPGSRQETLDFSGLTQNSPPISVIWGRDDRILPIDHADRLPDWVEIHRLEGVGHMPHMDASIEVDRLIVVVLG